MSRLRLLISCFLEGFCLLVVDILATLRKLRLLAKTRRQVFFVLVWFDRRVLYLMFVKAPQKHLFEMQHAGLSGCIASIVATGACYLQEHKSGLCMTLHYYGQPPEQDFIVDIKTPLPIMILRELPTVL